MFANAQTSATVSGDANGRRWGSGTRTDLTHTLARTSGTLLILPQTRVRELVSRERSVRVKYGFSDEEPRRCLLTLTLRIMQELARVHSQGHSSPVSSSPRTGAYDSFGGGTTP